MTKKIQITIINNPNALQSAVQGFRELFLLANKIIIENQLEVQFSVKIIQPDKDIVGVLHDDIVSPAKLRW